MEAGFPILWLSVIAPMLVGLAAWADRGRRIRVYAVASMASLSLPMLYVAYYAVRGALAEGVLDPLYYDATGYGIGYIALALDALSAPVVFGVSLVTAFVALYSVPYMEVRVRELAEAGEPHPSLGVYFMLYNMFAAAMLGLALSTNLVLFYLFLELTLVPSFLLIAYYGYGDRRRIALLYFVWTHVGAAVLLAGIVYYGLTLGTFDYLTVPGLEPVIAEGALASAARVVAGLMLVGLLVKMAVAGLHMWLPYAHAEAPTPISALLSPNLIGLAGYAIARFVAAGFPGVMEGWRDFLVGLGIVTIIYGGLVALRQADFKRFLAYSSVSQMGYILAGVASMTKLGLAGAMLFYLSHAIGKAILFMVAGVFIASLHGLRDLGRMGGLARLYPRTAALSLFGFMHLVGMPPSFGFWAELLVILGLARVYALTLDGAVLLATALILALGVSAAYSFVVMRKIFFGRPRVEGAAEPGQLVAPILAIAVAGFTLFLAAPMLVEPLSYSSFLAAVEASLGG